MFKFDLKQQAAITVSGERGVITGRAEYVSGDNMYQLEYKAADGRAVENWFREPQLEQVS